MLIKSKVGGPQNLAQFAFLSKKAEFDVQCYRTHFAAITAVNDLKVFVSFRATFAFPAVE